MSRKLNAQFKLLCALITGSLLSVSTKDAFAEEITHPALRNVRSCVVFLFENAPADSNSAESLPIGTGFIMGIESAREPGKHYKFVVTNQHVIQGRKKVAIRLDKKSGPGLVYFDTKLESSGPQKNLFCADDKSIDLAAVAIPDVPDTEPTFLDHSMIVGKKESELLEVQEGTEVVGMGYLTPYAGISRNFPVMRFGKIALLTDERWWDGRSQVDKELGNVVEIYNVGGSSGSPVALQPNQFRLSDKGQMQVRRVNPMIVGVIKGHPRTPAEIVAIDSTQSKPKVYPLSCVTTLVSTGVAVMEPGSSLQMLMKTIADFIVLQGDPVKLKPCFKEGG